MGQKISYVYQTKPTSLCHGEGSLCQGWEGRPRSKRDPILCKPQLCKTGKLRWMGNGQSYTIFPKSRLAQACQTSPEHGPLLCRQHISHVSPWVYTCLYPVWMTLSQVLTWISFSQQQNELRFLLKTLGFLNPIRADNRGLARWLSPKWITAKSDHLGSIPETHTVEGKELTGSVVLWPPYTPCGTQTNTPTPQLYKINS